MKEKLKLLLRYFYRYKFGGILLFIRIYWLNAAEVNVPGVGKVKIRPGTTDAAIFTQIFIYATYDFPVSGEVNTILVLGGNNGMSARFFRARYPKAKIVVVEPDETNFAALCKNIEGYDQIIPLKMAVWKEDGFIRLDNGDSWAIKVDMDGGHKVAEAITMKTLLAKQGISRIDLLKIDIESAEKEVFEAEASFLAITRNMVVELHDWIKPGCAAAFFNTLVGYTYIYTIQGENTLLRDLNRAS